MLTNHGPVGEVQRFRQSSSTGKYVSWCSCRMGPTTGPETHELPVVFTSLDSRPVSVQCVEVGEARAVAFRTAKHLHDFLPRGIHQSGPMRSISATRGSDALGQASRRVMTSCACQSTVLRPNTKKLALTGQTPE